MLSRVSPHLTAPPAGFARGYTRITTAGSTANDSGIEFGVLRLAGDESLEDLSPLESAFVLLHGEILLCWDDRNFRYARQSMFDEAPACLHVARRTRVRLSAGKPGAEIAIMRTANGTQFASRLFEPAEIQPEYRGAGLAQNACLRNVRLIFDRAARPESNLVVGEVVNYPGRWSSYPPHHHDQPEIYHYRFTAPHGYGHAEIGETVVKVRDGDTITIPPGLDHAQVSAPGYGMYYLWMIRHLPGNPYTGFTFAPEHQWTLDPARQGWRPQDLPRDLA